MRIDHSQITLPVEPVPPELLRDRQWFVDRAGKTVYRSSTLPAFGKLIYRLKIPKQPTVADAKLMLEVHQRPSKNKKKVESVDTILTRLTKTFNREIDSLHGVQVKYGLKFFPTKQEGYEVSTLIL